MPSRTTPDDSWGLQLAFVHTSGLEFMDATIHAQTEEVQDVHMQRQICVLIAGLEDSSSKAKLVCIQQKVCQLR